VGLSLDGELSAPKRLRRTFAELGLGLVLGIPGWSARGQQPLERRWPLAAQGSVRLVAPAGRIRVTGWEAETLAVSGPGKDQLTVTGDEHVRTLVVARATAAAPGTGARAGNLALLRTTLDVHLPRGVSVWVKTETADITVEGVDGVLDLHSVSGTIQVVGTPGDVSAETMDGNVEIAGGSARARVRTMSGAILLRGASVDLEASTLSGTIVVRAAGWQRGGTGVQRGRFQSVTGDVRFDGEVGRGGIVELETQSGTIGVRLPRTSIADFDLLTIGGAITNRLTSRAPARRPGGGAELRFATGAGGEGAQVTARSFKGNIILEAK
jgi:hypothetical protein